MKKSKVIDNLRFMMNELSRQQEEHPKHEILVKIRTLKAAIEEMEKNDWTPTSEGHPEDDEEVIVTREGLTGRYTTCDEYEGDYFGWSSGAGDDVIAWMPMPEPYNPTITDDKVSKDSRRLAEREAFFRD